MPVTKDIADRFRDLDFHDDTFVGMTILPTQARGDITGSVIELRFSKHQNHPSQVLQFIGCANLRVGLDFDVLASNLLPNTSSVDAHVDTDLMRTLMQSQKEAWDVNYGKMRSPLDDKLDRMDELVCFRVQLFGGVVEVIARDYRVQTGDV
jgi:hypothetical protein